MDNKKRMSEKVISLLLAMVVSITTLPLSSINVNASPQSATTITGQEMNIALKKLAAEWDSSQSDYIYNESAREASSGVMTIYSSETITAKARQVVDARTEMQAEAELSDEPIVEEVTDYTPEVVPETTTQPETESYSEVVTEPEITTEATTEPDTTTEEYIPIIETVTNLNNETAVYTEETTTEEIEYTIDTVDTNIQAIVWSEKAPVDGMNTISLSEDGNIVAWYEPASVKEQADLYNGIDHVNVTDPDGNTIKVYKEYFNTVYIYSYVEYADLYTYFNNDMSHAFENMAALSDISALRHFRTDTVENMSYMFADDYSLTDISPISSFNTSRLADVSYMFNGASYLTDVREYMSEHTYDSYADIKRREANDLKDLILGYVYVENEDSLQISGLDASYENSNGNYPSPYTAWSVSFYVLYEGSLVNTSVEEYPEWVYRNEGLDVPYHIILEDTENGSISLTDSDYYFTYSDKYYKNDTVYFYTEGSEEYEVSEIIIQDKNENNIEYSLVDEEYHIYSFTMPESNVVISSRFDIPEPETEETTEETTEEMTETTTEEITEVEESSVEETSETTTEEVTETEETSEIMTETETEVTEATTEVIETEEVTEEVTEETVEETTEKITEETSETEEESSEETTEEETTTKEIRKETEYPGVDISDIDTDDILSMRLLIAGTSKMLEEDTHVISSYNDTYILQFDTITKTAKAYVYYSKLEGVDFVAFDNNSFVISDKDDSLDEVIVDSAYETEIPSTEDVTEVLAEATTEKVTESTTEETSEKESEEVTEDHTEKTEESTTTVVGEAEETSETEEITIDVPSNPLTELTNTIEEDSDSNVVEAYDIALIDTGADGADKSVSMIGSDVSDENGHGTLLLKQIKQITSDATILSIKVADSTGKANISAVYAAIQYAIESNVKYINISMSALATEDGEIIEAAINEAIDKGIVVIGAAGNNNRNAKYYIPGNIEGVYVIGSASVYGSRASFSNYGDTVDYNVMSNSTSEAAAIFAAFVYKNGFSAIDDCLNENLIFEVNYETEEIDEENKELYTADNYGVFNPAGTIIITKYPQSATIAAQTNMMFYTDSFIKEFGGRWPAYCIDLYSSSPNQETYESNDYVTAVLGYIMKHGYPNTTWGLSWDEAQYLTQSAVYAATTNGASLWRITGPDSHLIHSNAYMWSNLFSNGSYEEGSGNYYGNFLYAVNLYAAALTYATEEDANYAMVYSSVYNPTSKQRMLLPNPRVKLSLEKSTNPSNLLTIDKTLYSIDGAVFQLFTDKSATTPYSITTGGNEYYIGFKMYKNTAYIAQCLKSKDTSNRDNWTLYRDSTSDFATSIYVDRNKTYSVKEIIAPSSGLYDKDNSIVAFENITSSKTFTFTDNLRYGYISLTKNTIPSDTKSSTDNAVYVVYTSNGRLYNDGTYYYGFRISNKTAYAVRCLMTNNTMAYSNWKYITTSDSEYSIPSSISGNSKDGYYVYVKVPAADTTTAYSVKEIIAPSNNKFNIDETSYSINVTNSKVSRVTSTEVERTFLTIKKISDNPTLSGSNGEVYDQTMTATFTLYKTLSDANNKTNAIAILTTFNGATEEIELSSVGTYYAVETSTPKGFIEDTTPFAIEVGYGQNTFTRSNTPYPAIKVTLYKTDAKTGAGLTDATFMLYQWSASAKQYVKVGNLTSNITLDYNYKEGQYSYIYTLYQTNDNQGKFVIDETATAVGYKNDKNVTSAATGEKVIWSSGVFTAGEQPTIEGGSYDADTYTFSFNVTNEQSPIVAKLHKISRDTSVIMDKCTFLLYEWSEAKNDYVNTNQELTWIADSSDKYGGYYQTTELYKTDDNQGNFKIVETETMDGYKILSDGSVTFSIDSYISRGETSFFVNLGTPVNNPEITIQGNVVVKKYADSTNETPAAHDAVFKVYAWTGTSSTSGQYDTSKAIDTLRYSSALDAYVSTYNYTIHFNTDSSSYNAGKFMIVEEKAPSGTLIGTDTVRYIEFEDTRPNTDTQTITLSEDQGFVNKRNSFTLEKRIIDTETTIPGVSFSFSNGTQIEIITTDKTSDWTVSRLGFSYKCDDGIIYLREIYPGTYTIKETYAPDPFVVDSNASIKFSVSENGYIKIDGEETEYTEYTKKLYVYNSVEMPLYLTKQDDGTAVTGTEVRTVADSGFPKGTVFTVTEWDASKNTWSDTETATLVYSNLFETNGCQFVDKSTNMPFKLSYTKDNAGKYLIKETKATEGYIFDASEVTIQIKMDANNGAQYAINNGTYQKFDQTINVEFVNSPNKMMIEKVDKSGNRITIGQAGFSIVNTETGERLGSVGTVNGIATFYRVPAGTWNVYEEFAPTGYVATEGIAATFTMNEDGTITVDGKVVSSITVSVPNSPESKLRITKVDSNTDLQKEYYTGFPVGTKFNLSPYVDSESKFSTSDITKIIHTSDFAKLPAHVTVKFDGNGATVNTFGTQTFYTGVSGNAFTGTISRTGYTFVCWSEKKTATSGYSVNNPVWDSWINAQSGTTVILYAIWQQSE